MSRCEIVDVPAPGRRGRAWIPPGLLFCLLLWGRGDLRAQLQLDVQEFTLSNGLTVLILERHQTPQIACWLFYRVGSVNERPGITGISHLTEHMMFKGTKAIGTKDAARDEELTKEIDRRGLRIRELQQELGPDRLEAARAHDLRKAREADAGPAPRGWELYEEMTRLRKEMDALLAEERKIMVTDEMWNIYLGNGATGLNAFTSEDFTAYVVTVPSNKLELFLWLESDRMANAVFREFWPEQDVVEEERRLRTESTPDGRFHESLDALFWEAMPYSWPVVGWMSDIENITPRDLYDYVAVHYAPNNAVLVLVGDLKADAALPLVKRYFERIPRGEAPPPAVATREPGQAGEKRLLVEANGQSRVVVRYHAPGVGHPDAYALDVAAEVLSGRSGRLYRSLVDEKKLAASTSASSVQRRYGGYWQVSAMAREDADLADVEGALLAEVERLGKEPVSDHELVKVKNQVEASYVLGLSTLRGLVYVIGWSETILDWRYVTTYASQIQKVTAADVRRVSAKYLAAVNRTVGVLKRRKPEAPPAKAPARVKL